MLLRSSRLAAAVVAASLSWSAWSGGETKSFTVEFESERFLSRGDLVITQSDIDGFLKERVPEDDRAALLASPDRIGELLNNLILTEAFLPKARESGLLDDPAIQARLYRVLGGEVRRVFRDHYMSTIELESYENSAREFFLTRGSEFMHPDTIDFEHILVAVTRDRPEVEAMKRIVDLHERLNRGEEFASVAARYSDDPSVRENQGLMTNVLPSTLVSQLAATLAEVPVGQYSDPVRTRFGWHIVRLIEVHPGEQMSWDEARERAERIARDRHMTRAWERMLRDIQEEPVVFAAGAVARLLERYGLSADSADYVQSVESLLEDN
jgi:peptidyl-prolyl cis-trans isomerase C